MVPAGGARPGDARLAEEARDGFDPEHFADARAEAERWLAERGDASAGVAG
ncbi:MAG: hypothetical protein H6713_38125 [Myxococcales bacterium]|nr:hypothetical protein [Myxococcales bacterium]